MNNSTAAQGPFAAPGPSVVVLPALLRRFAPTHLG
ncbi:hypothetical protein ACVW19_005969 [Streptomyces sp. TE5632]